MTPADHPVLSGRDLTAVLAAIRERLPAYTPDWHPGATGPGAAVLQVLARYLEVLGERLNQAPTKNAMAFLDLLGLDTIAAQGARAPVVFRARPGVPDGQVPAGTQVGARAVDGGDPVTFETEQAIALAAGRLTDVVTIWPGRDGYADHSADIGQGHPVTLFEPLIPVPHELYLAHDVHLALAGTVTVEVQFDLATPASHPVRLAWEYWDGTAWRGFKDPVAPDTPGESFDGTAGLTRSGVVRLAADCAEARPTTVHGVTSCWVRARATEPMPPTEARRRAEIHRVRLRTSISKRGVVPDSAYANQLKLDLSNAFPPFGPAPTAGSVWYLSSKEAFGKPAATVWFSAKDVKVPREDTAEDVEVAVEMWDGAAWQVVRLGPALDFVRAGGRYAEPPEQDTRLSVTVPVGTAPVTVNGEESFWARFRMTAGAFVHRTTISVPSGDSTVAFDVFEYAPPVLAEVSLDYRYDVGTWEFPAACLTYNDFQWADRGERAHGTGRPFEPFVPVADRTPTLYLGFDAPLPADVVGLYLDVDPAPAGGRNPTLRWECWDGTGWRDLPVTDETAGLAQPGMVRALWPGTPPAAAGPAALPRFGIPRTWLRSRMDADAPPARVRLLGCHANAVWAEQAHTVSDEILGSSTGLARQVFFFRERPVLRGEVVEVRELTGARAATELPLLIADLERTGMSDVDVRLEHDRRTGSVSEVWVRWRARPNLFFSGPDDRHYVVERTRGRLLVGDGRHGRIPPPGVDSVRARRYRSGGGQRGNVPAGAVTELISGVLAESVTNPRAATGGADAQPTADVLRTGPEAIRHRRQAVSLADYEALAREASPAVALARALPATHPSGRPAPGWVTVVVVPHGHDPRPEPSFELRRRVERYLAERVPAPVVGRVAVIGPRYLPIGVNALIAPTDPAGAGPVYDAVVAALSRFLHPLQGGPPDRGGAVYLSAVATLVEGLAGVDHVRTLELVVDGSPQGDAVPVPPDRLVASGPLRISLVGPSAGGEG